MNKREKKEAALNLAESQRLEHLRKLGKKQRSESEEKEFSRLYQKTRRLEQRAQLRGEKSPHDKFSDAEEFWEANRLLLKRNELDELLEAQEQVLDIEFWMQRGFDCDPSDQDYVSLEEGMATITEHVAMCGVIHDDPVEFRQHPVLQDESPLLWTPRDAKDPIHGWTTAFYKNAEVFNALCQESPATETYARYGIRTALFAYDVRIFRQRIAEHERGKLQPDVRRAHLELESRRCWACNYEGHQPQALVVPPTTTA